MASSMHPAPRDPALDLYAAVRSTARHDNHRQVIAQAARYLGAISIFLVGAVHAQQYYGAYFNVVPTIGPLFLLSFIGAAIVGTVLISPMRRLAGRLVGDAALVVAALGAISIAVGTLVSLLISEYVPLFGFMESGYRLAVVLTLLFDVMTTVFLGTFVAFVAPQLLKAIATTRRSR